MRGPPTAPWGYVPLALVLDPAFAALSPAAMRLCLVVMARQNGHGGWWYTRQRLAVELGLAQATCKNAMREARRAGILTVELVRDASGSVESLFLAVPAALPVVGAFRSEPAANEGGVREQDRGGEGPSAGPGGGPRAGPPTSSYRETDHREPPNPPRKRGGQVQNAPKRKARKDVDVPGVGVVNLAAVHDPQLRARDRRKIEAVRAAQEAAETAEKEELARRERIKRATDTERQHAEAMLEGLARLLAWQATSPAGKAAWKALDTDRSALASLVWTLASWNPDGGALHEDDVDGWREEVRSLLVSARAHHEELLRVQAIEEAHRAALEPLLADVESTFRALTAVASSVWRASMKRSEGRFFLPSRGGEEGAELRRKLARMRTAEDEVKSLHARAMATTDVAEVAELAGQLAAFGPTFALFQREIAEE